VTVVTPAVYQALVKRGLGPRLKPPVEPLRLSWRFRAARALLHDNLAAVLAPASVYRFAAEGGTGVPLFDEDELHAFLSEADQASPESPRKGQWWEFWPTTNGSYAMFPADDARQRSVATTLWIPAYASAYVHRIDVSSLLPVGQPKSGGRPVAPARPCQLLAKESEPGAPYVGRCSNAGCTGDCSSHVVVLPDDGIYRLLGCDC
jgi:hypothetical protein